MSLPVPSPLVSEHARALALLHQGEPGEAAVVLEEALRRALVPEALNDLAVLMDCAGERDTAADLLRAVLVLRPEHAAATRNLDALTSDHAGAGAAR